MHAELVEFNDYLIRKLTKRNGQLGRLKDELTALRGPVINFGLFFTFGAYGDQYIACSS